MNTTRSKDSDPIPRLPSRYHPPEANHTQVNMCLAQNNILCGFGGLDELHQDLIFRWIPKAQATLPSNRQLYLDSCEVHQVSPNPNVLSRLSYTMGRHRLTEIQCSGLFLGDAGIICLAPLIVYNKGLTSLHLRSCNLTVVGLRVLLEAIDEAHDGSVPPTPDGTLRDISGEEMMSLAASCTSMTEAALAMPPMPHSVCRISLLDLSCNPKLGPESAELLTEFIRRHPSVTRVTLQKTALSRTDVHNIYEATTKNRELCQHLLCGAHKIDEVSEVKTPHPPPRSSLHTPRRTLRDTQSTPPSKSRCSREASTPQSTVLSPSARNSPSDDSPSKELHSDTTSLQATRTPPVLPPIAPVAITRAEFFSAVNAFRTHMSEATGMVEMDQLETKQPELANLVRRRLSLKGANNSDTLTFMDYLESIHSNKNRKAIRTAVLTHSEFVLTQALIKPTTDRLTLNQKLDILQNFIRLDKRGEGFLTRNDLLEMAEEDWARECVDHALSMLGVNGLDQVTFTAICAPYIIEQRRKRKHSR